MKESSDCETLIALGIYFQIWGAAEEKARRPNFKDGFRPRNVQERLARGTQREIKIITRTAARTFQSGHGGTVTVYLAAHDTDRKGER